MNNRHTNSKDTKKDADVIKKLGDDFFRQGKYEDAIKYYMYAINIEPNFEAAWHNMGYAYFRLGQVEEANECKNQIKKIKDIQSREFDKPPINHRNIKKETSTIKVIQEGSESPHTKHTTILKNASTPMESKSKPEQNPVSDKKITQQLPNFYRDDTDVHPFTNQIKDEVSKSEDQCLTVKFNALLCGYGYLEYDDSVIIEIQKNLRVCELFLQIPLDKDLNRDELVKIIQLKKVERTPVSIPELNPCQVSQVSPIQKAIQSTVQVITKDGSVGTGFIVDSKGIVVTARHVVEKNGYSYRNVIVRQNVGKSDQKDLDAVVFLSHRKLDYALLWLLDDGFYPELHLGDPNALEYTQTVYAIGCPAGLPITVTKGIIGNPLIRYLNLDCIQCDAAIDHGNSGGPLLNEKGEVIGITLWGFGNYAAAKFSLPIDYLSDDLEKSSHSGKIVALQSTYCPSCGYSDFSEHQWYCRNCGFQFQSEDQ